MEWISNPSAWIALLTLTVLEIVLGIDNIIFISILSNKLPESQQTAYTLHKLEGLSYEEIAEIMQKSVSSVESIMHRAKSNLQKYLYDFYESDRKLN